MDNDAPLTPEQIIFAEKLLELVGENGSFEYEGEIYNLAPDYRERLREMTNKQLEQAISDE